jgi:hypothetical protein
LNSTFESARTGIWNSGSFFFLAESMTMSARPDQAVFNASFAMPFSFFAFFGSAFFCRRAVAFSACIRDPLVVLRHFGGRRSRLVRRGGGRGTCGTAPWAPSGVTMMVDSPAAPPPAALLLEDLFGLVAAGELLGDLRQPLLEVLGVELALLQPLAGVGDLLDVRLEDVAALELEGRPLALRDERRQAPARLVEGEADLLADLVVVGDRSFDSLVNGTQTEAMWTKITIGPWGSRRAAASGRSCATRSRRPTS